MYSFVCPCRVLGDIIAYWETRSIHLTASFWGPKLSSNVASPSENVSLLFHYKYCPKQFVV